MSLQLILGTLRGMPRIDRDQWNALDAISRWLLATRASVLFMTLMSSVFGGLFAYRDGNVDWIAWSCCCIALLFAHATNNLLNDYTDSRRGIDRDNNYRRQYGVHVLEDGLMSQVEFWRYVAATGAISLALGAYLVLLHGDVVLKLMIAGIFFVLFYTWPLKYFGLGEPAVLVVWGPLMIGGTYFVSTGHWSEDVTWLSLLIALGPTTVLFGKHIDKLQADARLGVRTLPVLLGEKQARQCVRAMILTAYVGTIVLVFVGAIAWPVLLVLTNLRSAHRFWRSLATPKPSTRPSSYPESIWPLWFSARAFDHNRRFTSLFLAGLLLELVLAELAPAS